MYFDIVQVAENATGLNCCIPISSGEQLSIELGNFLKLKYEDLTDEDITELQQPALDAAEIATAAADNADTATFNANLATENANNAAQSANIAAGNVNTAITNAETATTNANTAATNAQNVADTYTSQLANKVDKVEGKELSTNDYTTVDRNKLAGIETNAQKNVQSD